MNKMTSEHVGVIDIIHECERKKNKCTIAVVRDRMGYLRNEQAQKQLDELIDLGIVEYLVSNKTFILTKEGEKFGNNEVELEVVLTPYTRKRYLNQIVIGSVETSLEALGKCEDSASIFINENGWGTHQSGLVSHNLRDAKVVYSPKDDVLIFNVETSKVMINEYAELIDEIMFTDFVGGSEGFHTDHKKGQLIVSEASSNIVFKDILKLH